MGDRRGSFQIGSRGSPEIFAVVLSRKSSNLRVQTYLLSRRLRRESAPINKKLSVIIGKTASSRSQLKIYFHFSSPFAFSSTKLSLLLVVIDHRITVSRGNQPSLV